MSLLRVRSFEIANVPALWYNKEHFNCTGKEKLCDPAP